MLTEKVDYYHLLPKPSYFLGRKKNNFLNSSSDPNPDPKPNSVSRESQEFEDPNPDPKPNSVSHESEESEDPPNPDPSDPKHCCKFIIRI